MSFIIHNGRTPLSYFYSNIGMVDKQKDIIGFSWNSYFTYPTEQEAKDHLKQMYKALDGIKFVGSSFNRVHNLIRNLKVGVKQ